MKITDFIFSVYVLGQRESFLYFTLLQSSQNIITLINKAERLETLPELSVIKTGSVRRGLERINMG